MDEGLLHVQEQKPDPLLYQGADQPHVIRVVMGGKHIGNVLHPKTVCFEGLIEPLHRPGGIRIHQQSAVPAGNIIGIGRAVSELDHGFLPVNLPSVFGKMCLLYKK